MALRAALAALVLACFLPAQIPPPAAIARTVWCNNLTDHARRDVVTSVVPFSRGAYRGAGMRVDGGDAIQLSRFGATWPDGSWRQALVHFPARLGPRSRSPVRLVSDGTGARPGFTWTPAVRRGAASLQFGLQVGNSRAPFTRWQVLTDGHLVKAWAATVRVPGTTFWGWLALECGSGLDHARWWLWYGDSDPSDPKDRHQAGAVALLVAGGAPVVHFQEAKLGAVRSAGGGLWELELNAAGEWVDGESQAVRGRLLFGSSTDPETLRAEMLLPVLATSSDWPDSGAYGPWGYVPPLPDGFDQAASWRRAVAEWDKFPRKFDPWERAQHSNGPTPNQTGGQPDFSTLVLLAEAHGYPARLFGVWRSAYQEACRPVHWRRADVTMQPLGSMPLVHVWAGRVFFTSHDKLGKPEGFRGRAGHGYQGQDRQHKSINHLALATLLTGDRLGLELCRWQAHLYMGESSMEQPPPNGRGNAVIAGMSAARGVGRMLKAALLLYLVTGRADLAQRMHDRVGVVERHWAGATSNGPVTPIWASGERVDNRKLGGQWPWWTPWENGFPVGALDAVDLVLGSQRARDLAWAVGHTNLHHGIWVGSDNLIGPGDAVAWKGGRALTAAEIAQGQRKRAPTGFNNWVHSGVAATRRMAVARGDQFTVDLADAFLAQQHARPFNWGDAGWMAVR